MATIATGSMANDSTAISNLETTVGTVDSKLVGAVNSVVVFNGSYTINTSDWSSTTYNALETIYPHASGYAIEIGPSASMTSTELEAYQNAVFAGSPTANTLTATGTKPTISLPVVMVVWQKQSTTVTS